MKVVFISLGCDKNTVDTQQMAGMLQDSAAQYTFTDDEWAFLQNTWAYTGKSDAMIAQFTIDELRAYIANNYKK